MNRTFVMLGVLALGMAGSVHAAEFDVIETRQAGQDLMNGTFVGIRAVVASKGDVRTLTNSGKAIARWIRQYPTLFPPGSDKGHNTKALPAIWTDRAGFEAAAGDLAAEADKLVQLAAAGDTDGVAKQVKAIGDACSACHSTYRAK